MKHNTTQLDVLDCHRFLCFEMLLSTPCFWYTAREVFSKDIAKLKFVDHSYFIIWRMEPVHKGGVVEVVIRHFLIGYESEACEVGWRRAPMGDYHQSRNIPKKNINE